MSTPVATILVHLKTIENERARRVGIEGLAAKVDQQRRVWYFYADLLHSARYGSASQFVFDELHGPNDLAQRDVHLPVSFQH